MKVLLFSSNESLVETFQALCSRELHELHVKRRWSRADGDSRSVVFLDLACVGSASALEPDDLRRTGSVVLLCPREKESELDEPVVAAARDVLFTPVKQSVLQCRLRLWDSISRQQEDLEILGRRVDELASESDHQHSVMHDARMSRQLAGRNRSRLDQIVTKTQMVTRLSRLINCLDLQTIVEACIERVPLLVDARFASLYFHDQKSGHLILERHNHPRKIADRLELSMVVNSPMSLAIERRKLILIEDFERFEREEGIALDRGFKEHYNTGSCIIAPLMSGHRVIGVLNLADKVTGEPFDREIDLPSIEQLCELIGASIYNIELFQEVERQAKTDGLTGLANRTSFINQLGKEFDRAERYRSNLSMLMIDMDRLKEINDTHGHQAGDLALKHVAEVIRASVRTSDLPARYGGDEFSVVLVETGLRQAQAMADRLLAAIRKRPLELEGESLPLSLSVGVGQYGNDATPEHFINRVDEALYRAKQEGRGRVASAASPAATVDADERWRRRRN